MRRTFNEGFNASNSLIMPINDLLDLPFVEKLKFFEMSKFSIFDFEISLKKVSSSSSHPLTERVLRDLKSLISREI
jgi:hypothetical protein